MNQDFIQRIIALRGEKGCQWLDTIPQLVGLYEETWNIKCVSPFPLSYNYVAPAETSDGKQVVLKISFPDNHEFIPEVEALKFYNGVGSIQILQEDRVNGVILLEKAEPGTRVKEVTPEDTQVSIIADVLKQLHKPIFTPHNIFPTILDWSKAFNRYRDNFSLATGPIPKWMFEQAEEIFTEYPKENKEQVLLHGDLHTDNVLLSQRGWLIIDPKGVMGEREFELGACLRNPYYDYPKGSDYKKLEENKIVQFSEELGFDKKRILDWTFACAVISLLWSLEDENKVDEIYIRNAELLQSIKF